MAHSTILWDKSVWDPVPDVIVLLPKLQTSGTRKLFKYQVGNSFMSLLLPVTKFLTFVFWDKCGLARLRKKFERVLNKLQSSWQAALYYQYYVVRILPSDEFLPCTNFLWADLIHDEETHRLGFC